MTAPSTSSATAPLSKELFKVLLVDYSLVNACLPLRWFALALLLLLTGPHPPDGYAADPSLGTVLPRGIPRGATAEISFHGSNLADSIDVFFHDEEIQFVTGSVVDANQYKCIVAVSPEARLGTHAVRVRTRSGLSNLWLVSVGELKEIHETEPNSDFESAQPVEYGTTVNGTVDYEDVDMVRVPAVPGDRIAVEVEALRLGHILFDPKLRLFGPEGHERISSDDVPMFRQDAGFVYVAQETGEHRIAVSESAYGGGDAYRYRLHVGKFPRPLALIPWGAVPGTTQEIEFRGDPGLGRRVVTIPPGAPGSTIYLPITNDLGSAPTPVKFRLADRPSTVEIEPNNAREQASVSSFPGPFDGSLGEPGDQDWFQFTTLPNQSLDVRVWGRELGSPIDPVLRVLGPDGGELLNNDDAVGVDSAGRVTFSATGPYTIQVRDHLDQGGDLYAYRVELLPVQPSLALTLLENKPAKAAVPQGGRTLLLLSATRSEFGGPLTFRFDQVPQGVQIDARDMSDGESIIPVLISAATNAAVCGAGVDMLASPPGEGAMHVGRLDQEVVLVYGQNETVFWTERVNRLALAVTDPAPFDVVARQPNVPVVRNGAIDLQLTAMRQPGFDSDIDFRIPWVPSGVSAGTARIPAGATQATIHLDISSGAALGDWKISVAATSAGYSIATPFINLRIADPWLAFEVVPMETEKGKNAEITVRVTQSHPFEGPAQLELLNLPGGTSTTAKEIRSGSTELRFPITVAPDAPVGKFEGLFARTIVSATGETILHQSGSGVLSIFEPLPAEVAQQAPPPEEPKPDQPKRKTRFPNS